MFQISVNLQEYNLETKADWKTWDSSLTFALAGHITEPLTEILYLFIPLLTMGIMNREVNSGTIKLLYSSPIRSRHIVLGKFFGTMAFLTTFAIAIILLLLVTFFSVNDVEYPVFFSIILAFYLLAGAYVAIGIFISSLTSYQIVAGVITFVILYLLQTVGTMWQQYDFVRDITYFLSISGRAKNLMAGLITTKDVLYFILIISLFLSFSFIKLRSIKEKGGWKLSFSRYSLVTVVVLLTGYLSSRPGYIGYLDVTRDQLNTIHPATQDMLSKLGDEPLTVTLYTNLFDPVFEAGLPQNRNTYIWSFWEKYIRFHPNTNFEYVYYYDVLDSKAQYFNDRYGGKSMDKVAGELAEANNLSKSLFLPPAEIRKMIDLSEEDLRLIMELEYKGKKAYLRTYPNNYPWPHEVHVSGSISRLIETTPSVLFTTGHYERSPYKYGEREFAAHTLFKMSEGALTNLGVDIDTINLSEKEIPATTNILVVADPKSVLSDEETMKIRNYLQQGGNAIFHSEPGKQDILNPLLETIGINVEKGMIVYPNEHEMPHILVSPVTTAGAKMAGEPILYYSSIYPSIKPAVQLPGAASLIARPKDGFTIEPIFSIKGNDSYWIENAALVVDSAAPHFSQAEGDVRKNEYITGIKLSRSINNKEQRIIVTSDADFMSVSRRSGQAFGNAGYSWCLYNEFPKYTNKPKAKDVLFTIGSTAASTLFKTYLYLLPVSMIILGTVILIRRKRK